MSGYGLLKTTLSSIGTHSPLLIICGLGWLTNLIFKNLVSWHEAIFTSAYPAVNFHYKIPSPSLSISFLLHTYLVGAIVIKKTVCYDSSPALHIAEARVIELPSGTSLAQFLMVCPRSRCLFIVVVALCDAAKKRMFHPNEPIGLSLGRNGDGDSMFIARAEYI